MYSGLGDSRVYASSKTCLMKGREGAGGGRWREGKEREEERGGEGGRAQEHARK